MTGRPMLVLVVGLPGAGKSTLATALSLSLGWPSIDKDTLKSTLLAAGIAEEIASSMDYNLMFAIGRDLLIHQKISIIFDSPDPYLNKITPIVREANANLKVILCLAPRHIRNRRIAEREGKLSQPVSLSRTEGDGRQNYMHLPSNTLILHTTQPLPQLIEQAIDYLRKT